MAGIRLKRWFAPRVAALVYRGEDGYFIAASENKVTIKVNDTWSRVAKNNLSR